MTGPEGGGVKRRVRKDGREKEDKDRKREDDGCSQKKGREGK